MSNSDRNYPLDKAKIKFLLLEGSHHPHMNIALSQAISADSPTLIMITDSDNMEQDLV